VKSAAGALHLGIFEQSEKNDFFSKLLGVRATLLMEHFKA
jgi:hypothetical protein